MRLARVTGGGLAVVVSALLLGIVLVRDVGLNPLNGWTVVLGLAGGAVAMTGTRARSVLAAWVMVLLAALPALVGGLGLLFLPSLALLPLGAIRGSDV